jgi:hypothetical protein
MKREAWDGGEWMKILSLFLFAAICLVIVLLAAQPDRSEAPGTAALKDPNPMKGNLEQFARMQQQLQPDIQLAAK